MSALHAVQPFGEHVFNVWPSAAEWKHNMTHKLIVWEFVRNVKWLRFIVSKFFFSSLFYVHYSQVTVATHDRNSHEHTCESRQINRNHHIFLVNFNILILFLLHPKLRRFRNYFGYQINYTWLCHMWSIIKNWIKIGLTLIKKSRQSGVTRPAIHK